ncbi:hypothetical protein D915_005960 [Fasciola hepatica]|uniref:Uncharacterized protein n=1 Tax=Fasciola hepatica TaxID=6192 RepID=A0A4E0RXQ1_FASHE|nr:hypothetical protein D915_005960 [Fasciola hepatica]
MSKMNPSENWFYRLKRDIICATLVVLILSASAVGFTIAGLILQQVIDLRPSSTNASSSDPFLEAERIEGLFEACLLGTQQTALCRKRSYGYYPEDADPSSHSTFSAIVGDRLAVIICLGAALLLALSATVYVVVLLVLWCRASQDTMFLLFSRLIGAVILFCSGVLYQLAVFYLHLSYVKERTSYTALIPDLFLQWPEDLRRNTDIEYSMCYYFFWASLVAVYLASIILVIITVIANQYYTGFDEYDKVLIPPDTKEFSSKLNGHRNSEIEPIFLVEA